MNSVDKLIFNTLASHRSVALPGVGSLVFERIPAKMKGSRKLFPPRNTVKFTTGQHPAATPVTELIDRAINDMPQAEAAYGAWLAGHEIKTGELPQTIAIEGAGEIKGGVFTPSGKLAALLNPETDGPMKISPRTSWLNVTLIILVVAIVAAAAYYFLQRTPEQRQHAYMQREIKKLEQRNIERAGKGLEMVAPPPMHGEQDVEEPVAQAVADSAMYHLVIEVFSTQENADRYIKIIDKKRIEDRLDLEIVPLGSKFVVSIYHSPDKKKVDERRNQLLDKYPDIWVHKQKL